MRATILRVLYSPLAYPAALLFAAAFLIVSEVSYRQSVITLDEMTRMDNGRLAIERLQQQLSEAESGQRGYLITGRPEYLEPYRNAVREVGSTQREILDYYAQQRPLRLGRARELANLADERMAELEALVRLREQGREMASERQVAKGVGKSQMDRLHELAGTLINEELRAIEAKRAGIYRTLMLNRLGIGALTAVSVLGLYLFVRQSGTLHREREQQRLALQAERDALERQVDARTRELRDLLHYVQTVREDEKARLARELHDELGALLTAAKLDVARLKPRLGSAADTGQLRERLQHLTESLNEVIALKRRIIENLRPSALSNLGLVPALEGLIDDMQQRLKLRMDVRLDDPKLAPPADLTVYRFVQEALTNAAKYAKAKKLTVSMRVNGERVQVEVADDGVGFDTKASRVGHHGLAGLRYRVEAVGGKLRITSAPGKGTRLTAELPRQAA
ncbi:MAG TPA: CHASE3 domain-containing protein [Burkholderiaceae bacterium]|nr:CHASE3 domain-containing protein [Burkholderiaceae bacterium]